MSCGLASLLWCCSAKLENVVGNADWIISSCVAVTYPDISNWRTRYLALPVAWVPRPYSTGEACHISLIIMFLLFETFDIIDFSSSLVECGDCLLPRATSRYL